MSIEEQGFIGDEMSQYAFMLKTVQTSAMRILIEAVKEIITDANLIISKTGIKIMTMDPSHTILIHLKLDATKFEKFYCEQDITIGISMLCLFKLIKIMSNSDTLTLYVEKDDMNRLGIKIENGEKITPFELGNIYTKRDWSDSEDFVEAIWLMLNKDKPDEYLLSSDETHTIKEFVELSCYFAGLKYKWKNLNDKLKTELLVNNITIMKISEKYFRPADVNLTLGNSIETRKKLNWKPKVSFKDLVKKMILYDISLLK